MSNTHHEIHALRVMVGELRAEEPPELAWDLVEARLWERIAVDARVVPFRSPVRPVVLPRVVAFAAVAAAMALGVSSGGSMGGAGLVAEVPLARAIEAAAVALAAGEVEAHDLTALQVGDVITAGAEPVTFKRASLAAWTLAPHSTVRVRSMGTAGVGVGHTVALERGSIRAEVTPRDPAEGLVEAFAVEVAWTRVAVHGTAFSVTREGDRAVVDVEHGAVAVGPVGNAGLATGHLVVGPGRASFSLDGGRLARVLPRDLAAKPVVVAVRASVAPAVAEGGLGVVASAPVHPATKPGPTLSRAVVVPAVEVPVKAVPEVEVPASGVVGGPLLTPEGVRASIQHCVQRAYDALSPAVAVAVSSTLRLQLDADGKVVAARFDPPLRPEHQACAGGVFGGRFADGGRSVDIVVHFQR